LAIRTGEELSFWKIEAAYLMAAFRMRKGKAKEFPQALRGESGMVHELALA
jgi:hypothetical protein